MTALPLGWTIEVEDRKASELEDVDSAFNGTQLVVYDPDGVKPPQAEWPMDWRANAARYAWALHEHRAAQARGEQPHPHVEPDDWADNLLQYWPEPVVPAAPEDWTGPLHERPGLFALKPADGAGTVELVTLGAAIVIASPGKLPAGPKMVINKVTEPWTYRIRCVNADIRFSVLGDEEDGDGHRKRVRVVESVDSIGVRFSHPDGRAAVALWWKRAGKPYAFAGAVRGRHGDENVPVELNAKALGAYLS